MLLSIHKVTVTLPVTKNGKMEKEENMKKAKLILLAGLAMAVSLTGCQKKEVKPRRCGRL